MYAREASGELTFHELRAPALADLEKLTRRLQRTILRFLRREGALPEDDASDEVESMLGELSANELCLAGATQGRRALGPTAGRSAARLFSEPDAEPGLGDKESKRARKLACRFEGFSLHAGTRVAERSRFGLEKLCRYVLRPPLASERLSRLPDGRLCYSLTRQWSNGHTSHYTSSIRPIRRRAAPCATGRDRLRPVVRSVLPVEVAASCEMRLTA